MYLGLKILKYIEKNVPKHIYSHSVTYYQAEQIKMCLFSIFCQNYEKYKRIFLLKSWAFSLTLSNLFSYRVCDLGIPAEPLFIMNAFS